MGEPRWALRFGPAPSTTPSATRVAPIDVPHCYEAGHDLKRVIDDAVQSYEGQWWVRLSSPTISVGAWQQLESTSGFPVRLGIPG
ncbi:MAG: hypothetical protein ABFR95_08335 [Actinomycetota bacterium]